MDDKTLQLLSDRAGVELKVIDPQERMDKTMAKLESQYKIIKSKWNKDRELPEPTDEQIAEAMAKFYGKGRKD